MSFTVAVGQARQDGLARSTINARCESPISSSFFDPLDDIPSHELTADSLRGVKRRKLDNASRFSSNADASSQDRVILYRLDININLEDAPRPLSIASTQSLERNGKGFDVSVQKWDRIEHGRFKCRLSRENGSVHELIFKAAIPEQTLALLQLALNFQNPSKNRQSRARFCVPGLSASRCQLRFEVFWDNAQSLEEASSNKGNDILALIIGGKTSESADAWSPRDFYESVHVPDKNDSVAESLAVDGLESTLFPYQKRTVRWMLEREGVDSQGQDLVSPRIFNNGDHGFLQTTDISNDQIWVNPWLGLVTTNRSLLDDAAMTVRGGILAEEMGLGKTVQCIAMILKHRRPELVKPAAVETKPGKEEALKESDATLIIAPDSIITQWTSEISMHAPSLRTFVYPGVSTGVKEIKGRSEKELIQKFMDSDVVLASYHTIAREIHYAEAPPDRSLRHKKQYKRKRSPLVLIRWWRCILDECQMVESGVSNAARVANQIPRTLAWAVSGTPLRKDSGDLWGLLVFLRLAPYCWSLKLWNALLDYHKPVFKRMCRTIALRHTKDLVREDIQLPPQKRVVVTVPFTQIEEQHYSNMFEIMCHRVGVDQDGGPLDGEWDPDDAGVIETMRSWLTQLRQICLHPQVGERNRRALGQIEGTLRTVDQVLEVMNSQNDAELHNQERAYLICHLRRGQLFENAERSQDALAVWKEALLKIQRIVKLARENLDRAVRDQDEKVADTVKNAQLGPLRMRLRSTLEIEHMATFFIANAYYQVKSDEKITVPESDEFKQLEQTESKTYDTAKLLRREILSEPQSTAEALMLSIKSRDKSFPNIPQIPDFDVEGGIETRGILDRIDNLFYDLNQQATKLDEWRAALADFLLQPLVDREEQEVQGDEYDVSTKQQDEVYVYMDCFRAMVSDRKDVLTGLDNILIKGETAGLMQKAKNNEGHSPELMIEMLQTRQALKPPRELGSMRNLLAELRSRKTRFKAQEESGSTRARTELAIVNDAIAKLQSQHQTHMKVIAELEREVNLFSETQNARLDYYRQLQHISDSVASSDQVFSEASYAFMEKSERKLQGQIDKLESRARYLSYLKTSGSAESERRCIICQEDEYEQGVLTSCGHTFCSPCINEWLRASSHCPTCKKILRKKDFHQITYRPQDLQMEEEEDNNPSASTSSSSTSSPSSTRHSTATPPSIYSQISPLNLTRIKSIDLPESFSTKIDMIARHILWLRTDSGGTAKTVLFSQYQSFCPVHLANAFRRLHIRFAVVGDANGVERFKHDPAVEALLMHAGSQASGLNLVNATHVVLCEPLVNTALELQAVARVHRIGQHRPTTVWMYLVEGTVEKAIYDLSVQRRLSHIGKDKDSSGRKERGKRDRKGKGRAIDADTDADGESGADVTQDLVEAVDAAEMQENPLARVLKKGNEGGEIVGKEDLWTCLFGYKQRPRASAMPALETMDDRFGMEEEEEEEEEDGGEDFEAEDEDGVGERVR